MLKVPHVTGYLSEHFGSDRVAPLVAYLVSERCEVTGEAFAAGGGKFARVVYAASPALDVDASVDAVAKAMSQAMGSEDWTVFLATHDSMLHLGMPPDLER